MNKLIRPVPADLQFVHQLVYGQAEISSAFFFHRRPSFLVFLYNTPLVEKYQLSDSYLQNENCINFITISIDFFNQ